MNAARQILELVGALALLGALAWLRPRLGAPWWRAWERWLARVSARPGLAAGSLALLALALQAGLSWGVRWPVPAAHDEFSYLLAADTFAHGRLTNPPHPLGEQFESFHVLQRPTYASKYPPAQGAVLALGQVLTGQPIVGAWLSVALACAVLFWAWRAWLPARWALAGALVAVVHPTLLGWGQSYWGGAVAVIGGALVVGAAKRGHGWWLGIGLAILANSRPFEGLILALIVGAWLLFTRQLSRQLVLPLTVVMLLTGLWMGYYNWRVTGSALRLPYSVYQQQYGVAPLFAWQEERTPPTYRHEVMRRFYAGGEEAAKSGANRFGALLQAAIPLRVFEKPVWLWGLPLLGLAWWLWDRRTRWALLGLGTFGLAVLTVTWTLPHYAAPAAALAGIVLLNAWRRLGACGWRGGLLLARSAWLLAGLGVFVTAQRLAKPTEEWAQHRERIGRELAADPRRHLVIVRYAPTHAPDDEWVYNAADVDRAPVVWARTDQPRLRQHFAERRIWWLDADAVPPRLTRAAP